MQPIRQPLGMLQPCAVEGVARARFSLATVTRAALICLPALTLAACSSATNPISIGSLPAADSVLANNPPTKVYADLAQKALSCWVGPKGPLKATHIFHAEAASPTTGGRAEIVLHERDTTSPHPWGKRAFRIELTDVGGGTNTQIAMMNISLPRDLADALRIDVVNWAHGTESCQAQVVRPPPPDPVPEPAVKPPKKKKPS